MKTAIIYASWHMGNTRKLVEAIADRYPVDCFDVEKDTVPNLSDYDLIGFASGIYVEKPSKTVTKLMKNRLPDGKKVFFLYTCGIPRDSYMEPLQRLAAKRKAEVLGIYGCAGFFDFKLFKRNEGHPNEEEIAEAVKFYEKMSLV